MESLLPKHSDICLHLIWVVATLAILLDQPNPTQLLTQWFIFNNTGKSTADKMNKNMQQRLIFSLSCGSRIVLAWVARVYAGPFKFSATKKENAFLPILLTERQLTLRIYRSA